MESFEEVLLLFRLKVAIWFFSSLNWLTFGRFRSSWGRAQVSWAGLGKLRLTGKDKPNSHLHKKRTGLTLPKMSPVFWQPKPALDWLQIIVYRQAQLASILRKESWMHDNVATSAHEIHHKYNYCSTQGLKNPFFRIDPNPQAWGCWRGLHTLNGYTTGLAPSLFS